MTTPTDFAQLAKRRQHIDSQLAIHFNSLTALHADMNTPLLTSDGYPRADIDVASIRKTRATIIALQHDHQQLTDAIHKALPNQLANMANTAKN